MTNTFKENEQIPSTEVQPKLIRKRYTSAYKLDIVKQADACKGRGEVGALLRREGLYSSHLTKWRQLRAQGLLSASSSVQRGRKAKRPPSKTEYDNLQARCHALEKRIKQAEAIIDVQKKVSEIFGITLSQAPNSEEN